MATVTITVNSVNDAPVATNSSAIGDEDTAITGTVSATDVDGDTVVYTVVDGPANGSVTLNARRHIQLHSRPLTTTGRTASPSRPTTGAWTPTWPR